MYPDLGLLILRVFVSMVVIAHGLQKFGFLGGHGIAGTDGWLESIGFAPGKYWVWVAAIGFHSPNGFWNANNGWSWVSVIMAAALTIALTGFGAWSLDSALKLTYPDWLLPAWLIAVAVVAV